MTDPNVKAAGFKVWLYQQQLYWQGWAEDWWLDRLKN